MPARWADPPSERPLAPFVSWMVVCVVAVVGAAVWMVSADPFWLTGALAMVAATAMIAVRAFSQIVASRRRGFRGVLTTNQSARGRAPPGMEGVLGRATEAILACGAPKVSRTEGRTTVLRGDTRKDWKSEGDIIRVECAPAEDGGVDVRISSRPASSHLLMDKCRNHDNVQRVLAAIGRGSPDSERAESGA